MRPSTGGARAVKLSVRFSDFRIRTLRRVLDTTIGDALSSGEEESS